ncbi:NUDIX hydrolase [Candidatus Azambacteria bacterium]|nr:NUDIX hydrolase [Candidatus Azambacteria bacterium]
MPKIIIASGPVIVENNKVLLNKHGDDDFWKFCGGKVEDYNTDLIENARREVKEEMGIYIEILDKNPFIMHIQKEKESEKPVLKHFKFI